MYKSACERCGKIKEYKYKSWIKRFCSHGCSNKAVQKQKAKRVTLICEQCNKEFELLESVKRSREKNGIKIKYCSKKCEGLGRRKRKEVKCKNCGNSFETTRSVFCTKVCGYEYKKKTGTTKRNGYWYENGYKVLYLEDDRHIKEHIKITEDHIGRKLREDEVVHHKNEIRTDNRLENLQLMTRSEHSRYHRLKELDNGKKLF